MAELVVLLDEQGHEIGRAEKLATHHANTPLHLAFSCYVFNDKGEFLMTQRAKTKKVWPGVWTNSVCGHPAPDEDLEQAIKRRLNYELGMQAKDFEVVLPDYRYKTPPFHGIIENEFCPVYFAKATTSVKPNSEEVESFEWIDWQEFVKRAEADSKDEFSWWCKDQLKNLKDDRRIQIYTKMI